MKLEDFMRLIKAHGFTVIREEDLSGEPMICERKSKLFHEVFRLGGYMNNDEPSFQYYSVSYDLYDGYMNGAEMKSGYLCDLSTQSKYWGRCREKESKVLYWYDDKAQRQEIEI